MAARHRSLDRKRLRALLLTTILPLPASMGRLEAGAETDAHADHRPHTTTGKGDTVAIASNSSTEGRAMSRRVEFETLWASWRITIATHNI